MFEAIVGVQPVNAELVERAFGLAGLTGEVNCIDHGVIQQVFRPRALITTAAGLPGPHDVQKGLHLAAEHVQGT